MTGIYYTDMVAKNNQGKRNVILESKNLQGTQAILKVEGTGWYKVRKSTGIKSW